MKGTGSPRPEVVVEAEGRGALRKPDGPLDCGNSGTTLRLLAGVMASASFPTVLTGDASLSSRPMERVAEPLRRMGAEVRTTDGHPPLEVRGRDLTGIRFRTPEPSAQVKSAVLLAGVDASGETTIEESAQTRDHTERALSALGAPVRSEPGTVTVSAYQHGGFSVTVPGDPSAAAFLVAAAALAGGELEVREVGLNPSRLHFLQVMGRMGIHTEMVAEREELGEPVGRLWVHSVDGLTGTDVQALELPLVIDEVPILAVLAAYARGESSLVDAGELRVKESDRLESIARGIRGLGGHAGVEGDDLVVAGGGLAGGLAEAAHDHRIAMALAVAALGADGPSTVDGIEWAEVSFPGFVAALRAMGADIEVEP